MVTTVKIVGKKLAELRRGNFLSQDGLGRKMGLAGGSIGRLEQQDVGGMMPENFRKLADAVGLSPADLLAKIGVAQGGNGDVSLAVPQDVAQAARQAASAAGREPSDWMVDAIRDAVARSGRGKTGLQMKQAARPKKPKRGNP